MAKTEGERGPLAAWLVRHRKRLYGTDVGQLSAALDGAGIPVSTTTIRGWEAGSKPRPEAIAALERLFGEDAPRPETTGDLVAAIREQSAAIRDLVAAIREDRERLSPAAMRLFLQQLAAEGLLVVPDRSASTAAPRRRAEAQR